jgi:hypothetical protein
MSFKNILAQSIFNCPLLPSARNNLAAKRPMTQKIPSYATGSTCAPLFTSREQHHIEWTVYSAKNLIIFYYVYIKTDFVMYSNVDNKHKHERKQ